MKPTRRGSKRGPKRTGEFKSGLEKRIADQIVAETGKPAEYELLSIPYVKPAREHKYKPDFQLPNGIIIEAKGFYDRQHAAKDREKHILVKEQHPELDIRFVFTRLAAPIYPGSKTTWAMWCAKHGFKCAEKLIPLSWFKESKHQ